MTVPKAVLELVGAVAAAILSSPDPKAAGRRALEAAQSKAFDEAMRARRPKK